MKTRWLVFLWVYSLLGD